MSRRPAYFTQSPWWTLPAVLLGHLLVLWSLGGDGLLLRQKVPDAPAWEQLTLIPAPKQAPASDSPAAPEPTVTPEPSASFAPPLAADLVIPSAPVSTPPSLAEPPATRAAPPPPSAEDWALASTYSLKNAKRYRHHWGEHVRTLMGTAVAGQGLGMVRFRVEVAPNGRLLSLETLWATSAALEQRARDAVMALPPLPPTPNGKPLRFEKTIAFGLHDSGWPPLYRDDCLPDRPTFKNAFSWNGQGTPQASSAFDDSEVLSPQDLETCRRQLPTDSLDAVAADAKRQVEERGAVRLPSGTAPQR